jgi:hypothetical protein
MTGNGGSYLRVKRPVLWVEDREQGISMGEVLLLAALILGVLVVVHLLTGGSGPTEGVVPAALEMSGATMRVVGDVNGLAASDTALEGIPVRFPREDPRSLGACVVTVSTLMGDMGGIDMDQAAVTWTTGMSTVALPPLLAGPVEGPSWIIVSRDDVIPFQSDDGDRILEPGEQFTILFVAPSPLGPGARFTVEIFPGGGGIPLTISGTVPPRVTPVMDLDG